MITSTAELAEVLSGTALDGAEAVVVPIPLGTEALALRPPRGVDLSAAWTLCREKLADTGRWPLASTCWTAESGSWAERVLEEDLFSRGPFQAERHGEGVSSGAVIAAAAAVDLDAALERCAARGDRGRSFEEILDIELATLRHDCGKAPERQLLLDLHHAGKLVGTGALQRWLLRWEAKFTDGRKGPWWSRLLREDGYLEDFGTADYGEPVLLLLPTHEDWTALASLHFWGSGALGSAAAVALCRRWSERWEAEIQGHFGTMLFFRVGRPPGTLDEALDLAWEQVTLAQCTTITRGVSTLRHARVLVGRDRWSLSDRP